MRIGFIGLGAMGLPMAGHLVAAGHQVSVASRGRDPIEKAVALGAQERAPADMAAEAEIVVLCVPSSPQVEEVLDAMVANLGAGTIVVDCSTIDPEVERRCHRRVEEAGGRYLDAPISGGTIGAERGTLTVMVGGEAEVLEAARPALEPFSGLIVHVGGPGMGQVVKLCNNVVYAAQLQGMAEATAMAVKAGVDPAQLLEVLLHSTGDCVAVRTRLPVPGVLPDSPATNGWRPGFMVDLMAKDLDLALTHAAKSGVPLAATAVARQVLAAAATAGYGREDCSAVAKVVFGLAGIG